MKRSALLLILVLFLTACTQAPGFQSVDYFVGTEGVELDFLQGTPPRELNEQQDFDLQVLIHNRGAYDVVNTERVHVEVLYDSALLRAYDTQGQEFYTQTNDLQLLGRSFAAQNGEQDFFGLARYQANPIRSSFERSYPEIYVNLCYPYRTSFAQEICVDTDITNTDVRAQSCELTPSHSYSRGQGAPIAVTRLETTFEAAGPYALPVFTFTIENVNEGIVFHSPDGTCQAPAEEDMHRITFNAVLGNDTLDCPDLIYLEDGQAEIDCFIEGDGFLLSRANYVSILTAEIGYQYSETFSVDSEVQRQNRYYYDGTGSSCAPWEIESNGECITLCEYCVQNPQANDCDASETYLSNPAEQKRPLRGASCSYTKTECTQAGDNCIGDEGVFCIPGLYCGVPECAYDRSKNNAPRAGIEPGANPSTTTWYCTDRETTATLQTSCGCKETSYYVVIDRSDDCPTDIAQYTQVSGYSSPSLQKSYYSIEQALTDDQRLCVIVEDALGEQRIQELNP